MAQLNDSMAKQIMGELDEMTRTIDFLNKDLKNRIESLPGAVDKEMKRAGDDAIDSLAGRVAVIANNIAGDAAIAERHKNATKLTYAILGAFVLCSSISLVIGITFEKGSNAINLSTLQNNLDEATKATAKAESDLAAYQAISDKNAASEIEKIRAASGWAGPPDGRLAKKFFDSGYGRVVFFFSRAISRSF